ncbi:putative beta-lactamase [Cladorrhinum sp. PSN332]|nr:putative beta-lactamase [Cladorrhinum sp. PSN332]
MLLVNKGLIVERRNGGLKASRVLTSDQHRSSLGTRGGSFSSPPAKDPTSTSLLLPSGTSAPNSSVRLLPDAVIETIRQVFHDGGNLGGSVGILDADKCQLLNVGRRDVLHDDAPDEETIYLISSMTKPFLGVAIAILVNDEDNEISFGAPVKDIFPELIGRTLLSHDPGNKELTIAHLLAHQSEFIKTTNLWECPDGEVPWKTVDPIISLLRYLPQHDKYQQPGCFKHARNYSNECFALLAKLIKRVSGMPWGEFVTSKILEPPHMTRTFTGVTEFQSKQDNFAGTHSVNISETLNALQPQFGDRVTYQDIISYLRLSPTTPEPISVQPSQASLTETSRAQNPLGAAAMATLWSHILDRAEKDQGATYCGGWYKSRWPGADGDNVRRLQSISASGDEWFFFQTPTTLRNETRLALHHGGNMIGATSFCFLTVVLCNTRGFLLGAANLIGMLLADALDRNLAGAGMSEIMRHCLKLRALGRKITASYLLDLVGYEQELKREYPHIARGFEFNKCVGRYQLVEEVFTDVIMAAQGMLLFWLYGSGFRYPLRVKRVDTAEMDGELKVTFAMSMRELVPAGVGGNNRMNVKDFELVFRRKDETSGKFGEFVWVFDRTGAPRSGDVSSFVWKRS